LFGFNQNYLYFFRKESVKPKSDENFIFRQ
jgi:hypothetical protein